MTYDEYRQKYGLRPLGGAAGSFGSAPETFTAPAVPGAGASSLDLMRAQYGLGRFAPNAEPEEQPVESKFAQYVSALPEPLRRTAGGALRGLASALEPLQLPQDVFFGAIAGAIDPNTTIAGRLKTINFSDYLPGGAAPPRPSNGEEIFNLMGFKGEAAKWAGIGADLLVDPLVFGSWLRVTGKIAKIDDLVRLGDRVDNFISPIGFGREVGKVARKSPTISAFMDARTEALMGALRDPYSTVLGIQRFGDKATQALEWALPKAQVDRLRFGDEVAAQFATARRRATEMGIEVSEDSIRMLYRAQRGLDPKVGDQTSDLVQTYLKTMEEQSLAWEARLSDLNPVVREVIEGEVYETARRVGYLTYLGGREAAEGILDPATGRVASDAIKALDNVEGALPGRLAGDADRILKTRRGVAERDIIKAAQEQVATTARKQAERAGITGDALHAAEGKAVRSFNNYLQDTLQIDAKLGEATSGFSFISTQVRTRVAELTGDFGKADSIWQNVLYAGLKRGQAGIDELMETSTGISLSKLVDLGKKSAQEGISKRRAYFERLRAEQAALGYDRVQIRPDTFAIKMEDLTREADDIYKALYKREPIPPAILMGQDDLLSMQRAMTASEEAARVYREAVAELDKVTKLYPSGASEARYGQAIRRHLNVKNQAEERLSAALQAERDILEGARRLRGGTRPSRTTEALNAVSRRAGTDRLAEITERMDTLQKKLADSRFARKFSIDQVVAARQKARDTVGVGEVASAVPNPNVTAAVDDLGEVAFLGRNTSAEDIIAKRMETMTVRQAVEKPITYRELIDGSMNMQALPLGEYLSGLMNGHLRRTYALFGDTDDFKKYIDALKVGTIIPSRLVDEKAMLKGMAGFEDEARLIAEYQALMTRHGKGTMLKRSHIAQYLESAGVAPERVNGAMKSMLRAVGPQTEEFDKFMTFMDRMIPQYREIVRKLDNMQGPPIGGQPFVANQRFFNAEKDVPQWMLEQLGEIAQASASVRESAAVARRVVSRQEMFQNTLQVAKANGLVKAREFTDQFGVQYVRYADSDAVMGGFGGKWVHPHLYEELRRAAAAPKDALPGVGTRLRALVTGGFLASPSVIAANFFGGLYQGATFGIDPATMVRRLIDTFGDVNTASLGKRSELIAEIRRNLNIEVGGLSYQDFEKALRRLDLESFGLGPSGLQKGFDDVASAYEQFLKRPGIGKIRTRLAGLEGFQFTENWFKVAAYKEMKERLIRMSGEGAGPANREMTQVFGQVERTAADTVRRTGATLSDARMAAIEQQAAEFARLVVFDYSELPKSLDFLKRTGLVLFPGFTYFMAGRTLNAMVNRPGTLAVADRFSEALANASLDLEEQLALHIGTPEWMRQDQGVPMPFTMRQGSRGEDIVSVIPLNQLLPTGTILDGIGGGGSGNPWAQSITQAGVWGPLFEVMRALVTGDGEATLSAQFGNRVFDADSEGGDRARDVFRFLYNTMAPSNVKKLLTVDYENQPAGLLPALPGLVQDLVTPNNRTTMDFMRGAYTFDEGRTGRPDRGWREAVLSSLLRSPQVVALDGPIAGIGRELTNERAQMMQKIAAMRRRLGRAQSEGDVAAEQRWTEEINALQAEFNAKWQEYRAFHRAYELRQLEERR